jgi:hypothetical protein
VLVELAPGGSTPIKRTSALARLAYHQACLQRVVGEWLTLPSEGKPDGAGSDEPDGE